MAPLGLAHSTKTVPRREHRTSSGDDSDINDWEMRGYSVSEDDVQGEGQLKAQQQYPGERSWLSLATTIQSTSRHSSTDKYLEAKQQWHRDAQMTTGDSEVGSTISEGSDEHNDDETLEEEGVFVEAQRLQCRIVAHLKAMTRNAARYCSATGENRATLYVQLREETRALAAYLDNSPPGLWKTSGTAAEDGGMRGRSFGRQIITYADRNPRQCSLRLDYNQRGGRTITEGRVHTSYDVAGNDSHGLLKQRTGVAQALDKASGLCTARVEGGNYLAAVEVANNTLWGKDASGEVNHYIYDIEKRVEVLEDAMASTRIDRVIEANGPNNLLQNMLKYKENAPLGEIWSNTSHLIYETFTEHLSPFIKWADRYRYLYGSEESRTQHDTNMGFRSTGKAVNWDLDTEIKSKEQFLQEILKECEVDDLQLQITQLELENDDGNKVEKQIRGILEDRKVKSDKIPDIMAQIQMLELRRCKDRGLL